MSPSGSCDACAACSATGAGGSPAAAAFTAESAAGASGRVLSPAWTPVALSRESLRLPRTETEELHTPAVTAVRRQADDETRVHRGERARGETDDHTDGDWLLGRTAGRDPPGKRDDAQGGRSRA